MKTTDEVVKQLLRLQLEREPLEYGSRDHEYIGVQIETLFWVLIDTANAELWLDTMRKVRTGGD